MKLIAKIAIIAVTTIALQACCKETPDKATGMAGQPTSAHSHARQCYEIKNQMRNVNRQAPSAQAQLAQLDAKLTALECGPK